MSRRRTLDDVLRDIELRLSALESESAPDAEDTALSEGEELDREVAAVMAGERTRQTESGAYTTDMSGVERAARRVVEAASAPPDSVGEAGEWVAIIVPVCESTAIGGSYPLGWCDLDAAWIDGGKFKAPISHAPEGHDRECVNRIYPRIAPASAWCPRATLTTDHVYIPPTSVIDGRPVVSVTPSKNERGCWWKITLGPLATPASGEGEREPDGWIARRHVEELRGRIHNTGKIWLGNAHLSDPVPVYFGRAPTEPSIAEQLRALIPALPHGLRLEQRGAWYTAAGFLREIARAAEASEGEGSE